MLMTWFFVVWLFVGAKSQTEKCLTPNAVEGVCINLQECSTVYALANDFKTPMTIETLTFLMRSQCGFNGNNPKVCCPKKDVSDEANKT